MSPLEDVISTATGLDLRSAIFVIVQFIVPKRTHFVFYVAPEHLPPLQVSTMNQEHGYLCEEKNDETFVVKCVLHEAIPEDRLDLVLFGRKHLDKTISLSPLTAFSTRSVHTLEVTVSGDTVLKHRFQYVSPVNQPSLHQEKEV